MRGIVVKKLFSIGSLFFLILSCDLSGNGHFMLERYASEIQKFTGSDMRPFQSSLISYPSKRKLSLITAEIRTSFFDLFTLDKCGLQELIAEKNNAMGKVMPVSRLLHWEHLFIIKIKKCRKKLVGEINPNWIFINKLDSIIGLKEGNLPLVYWNATFSSPEFQKFFSLAGGPLSLSASQADYNPVYEALDYLSGLGTSIGKEAGDLDISVMEGYLYQIQKGRTAGNVLQSIDQLIFYLDQTSEHLDKFTNKYEKPLTNQQRNHLKMIFNGNYRGEIQPYLANVNQMGRRLLVEIVRLTQQQVIRLPAAFNDYYEKQISMENPSGLWQRFQAAIQRHTTAWEGLIDVAKISVGK